MRPLIRLVTFAALLSTAGWTVHGQTPATARVMRDKLTHAEGVLDSLMTSNYAQLAHESRALVDATKAPGWLVLNSPEYARHSAAFVRAAEDLEKAAQERNFDAAMVNYTSMTVACYQCHRYLKGARIAGRRP